MGKYCTNCGQELAPNSRFCTGCGIPLGKPPSFSSLETDTPVPDHGSVSLEHQSAPPDVLKAVDNLDASIAELDRVMRVHGMGGVTEQFEKPRQVIGGLILNTASGGDMKTQSNKAESGGGAGGFLFAGGMISTEVEDDEEDDNKWGWLGDLFGQSRSF